MPHRPPAPGSPTAPEPGADQQHFASKDIPRRPDPAGNDNDCTEPAGMSNPYPNHQQHEDSTEPAQLRHMCAFPSRCAGLGPAGPLAGPFTTPAHTSGGRPHTASENSGAVSGARLACSWCRACPPGRGDVREGFPAAGCAGGRGIFAARCRGATRCLGPVLSGCTVRRRRTR